MKFAADAPKISDIGECDASTTDAVYFAGGHACYTDYLSEIVTTKINEFRAASKIIALDCHGPVALCSAEVKNDSGAPLVSGLEVCCFTDSEETAVGAIDKIPFSMEQKLKDLGAVFKPGSDWGSNVCVSPLPRGVLITGQNPKSSAACADAVIQTLGA